MAPNAAPVPFPGGRLACRRTVAVETIKISEDSSARVDDVVQVTVYAAEEDSLPDDVRQALPLLASESSLPKGTVTLVTACGALNLLASETSLVGIR